MITQTINQGNNVIRIENAEDLKDAQTNKFKPGEYSRFFVNNKPVSSYMVLVKYIIDETQKNEKSFIPDKKNLKNIRKDLFEKYKNNLKKQLDEAKLDIDSSFFKNMSGMIDKIDESGMRIIE